MWSPADGVWLASPCQKFGVTIPTSSPIHLKQWVEEKMSRLSLAYDFLTKTNGQVSSPPNRNRMEAAGLPNLSNDYVMWLGNVTPKDSVALGIMFARKKMEVQTLEPFALAYGWCPWSIFNFIELIGIYLEIIFLNALPWIPPKFQNT